MRNMLGLVVSREEFEHNLIKAAQLGLSAQLDGEEAAQLSASRDTILARLERTEEDFPLLQLFRRCALEEFERQCVIVTYATVLDKKYDKLFAYLQDDITQKAPTTSLAVQLFLPVEHTMEEYLSPLLPAGTCSPACSSRTGWPRASWCCALRCWSSSAPGRWPRCPASGYSTGRPMSRTARLVTGQETARRLDVLFGEPGERVICLSGGPGTGKRFQVEHLMARSGQRCVFRLPGLRPAGGAGGRGRADRPPHRGLPVRVPPGKSSTGRESCCPRRRGCSRRSWTWSPPTKSCSSSLSCPSGPGWAGCRWSWSCRIPQRMSASRLFRAYLGDTQLGDGLTVEESWPPNSASLPGRWSRRADRRWAWARLDGAEQISSREMHRCCYRQVVHKLGDLASWGAPRLWLGRRGHAGGAEKSCSSTPADISSSSTRSTTTGGFDKKIAYGRGLSILFAGAPGTGKTMCAQVIANELNMELYKINISQIVSKYIGETEKNLQAVFNEAKRSNCVLFFDECDAIFGKRSEVKDAHDRNANVEVAYLLQQIEEHDGVCIMASQPHRQHRRGFHAPHHLCGPLPVP